MLVVVAVTLPHCDSSHTKGLKMTVQIHKPVTESGVPSDNSGFDPISNRDPMKGFLLSRLYWIK